MPRCELFNVDVNRPLDSAVFARNLPEKGATGDFCQAQFQKRILNMIVTTTPVNSPTFHTAASAALLQPDRQKSDSPGCPAAPVMTREHPEDVLSLPLRHTSHVDCCSPISGEFSFATCPSPPAILYTGNSALFLPRTKPLEERVRFS